VTYTEQELLALVPAPVFDPRLAVKAVELWVVAYSIQRLSHGQPYGGVYAQTRYITPEALSSRPGIDKHIQVSAMRDLRLIMGSVDVRWTCETFVTSWDGETYRLWVCDQCGADAVAADNYRRPLLHPCAPIDQCTEWAEDAPAAAPDYRQGILVPKRYRAVT
jgi:hypothetical protein